MWMSAVGIQVQARPISQLRQPGHQGTRVCLVVDSDKQHRLDRTVDARMTLKAHCLRALGPEFDVQLLL